jgi:poly(A) polymerase
MVGALDRQGGMESEILGGVRQQVVAWLSGQPERVYAVGGWVRDRLLGRSTRDMDLVVPTGGCALARELADFFGGQYYALDAERDTGRALLPDSDQGHLTVDVARLRAPTLLADLLDRDFTINAMAQPVGDPAQVVDPAAGRTDLQAGLLRAVNERAVRRDPVRSLRAVRLAAEFGFVIESATETFVLEAAPFLREVARERLRDELARILELNNSPVAIRELDRLGLLAALFPQLQACRGLVQPKAHAVDVLEHSLATLEALADRRPLSVVVKLAGLLHDVGKAMDAGMAGDRLVHLQDPSQRGAEMVRRIFGRLRFSSAEALFAGRVVQHHRRPLHLASQGYVSAREVYRFFRTTQTAGPAALLLSLADWRANGPRGGGVSGEQPLEPLVRRMLRDYFERFTTRVSPPPVVSGHDLMDEFGLASGPQIGRLLEEIREAQVMGQVRTRDQALALAKTRLARTTGRNAAP